MNQYNTQESGKLFETPETEPIVSGIRVCVEYAEKKKSNEVRFRKIPSERHKQLYNQLSATIWHIPTQKEK